MKIPFSPPYIDESVINEVVDSLKSGWITTGPKVKALEEEIKDYSRSKAVLCVNSWTSGAIMILRWLGLKEGDEVIIPVYTCSATALSVIHAGGKPVMVDISDDFNITLDAIKNAITNRTKAIIPVDIAGWPCDYEEIMSLVAQDNIKSLFEADSPIQKKLGRILVLSDAAHSFGASYKDEKVGSECDITIFSLHAVKNITTAEGGAICLNLPEQFNADDLYSELRMLSLNCQTKDAFTKTKAGGWKYDIIGLGMKINMPDVNAAIGLAQIRQYANLLSERKNIALKYTEKLSKYNWAQVPPLSDNYKESSYHLFALRINGINEEQRDMIIQEMSDLGVAVNVHFIPMPMLSFFKGLGYDINDFPKAYHNYAKEISLPIYPQLTNENINYIIDSLEASYNKVVRNDKML